MLARPRLELERCVSRDLDVECPSDTVDNTAPRPLVWASPSDTGLVILPTCIGGGTISSSEELVAVVPEDPTRELLVSAPGAPNSAVASLPESDVIVVAAGRT